MAVFLSMLGTFNHHDPFLATTGRLVALAIGLGVAWLIGHCLHNLFLHPLRRFPGPKLRGMTRIPYTLDSLSGHRHQTIIELHDTYGPIVRTSPNSISIRHPDALKDSRGHRKAGQHEVTKDTVYWAAHADNILGPDRDQHARFRRILSHAFSASAMSEQEGLIHQYVGKFLTRLFQECNSNKRPVDLTKWYNFCAFDIIGDLSFGEPFGCLDSATYHPWVDIVFSVVKEANMASELSRYGVLGLLLASWLIPKEVRYKLAENRQLSREKVRKRLDMDTARPDFIEKMLQGTRKGNDALSFDEMTENAMVLIGAGSETTATTLSGASYLLAMNPEKRAKLDEEIRSSFASAGDMDLTNTHKLPYLQAVLNESMRLYPAVPAASMRITPKGAPTVVAGFEIPQDTVLETNQWAIFHDPNSFAHTSEFIPERWLGANQRFANDRLDAVTPFSVGPRACIGRNLAEAEMRLILARMVWVFDWRLDESSRNWITDSKTFGLWDKPPLNVYLTPRAPAEKI